MTCDEIQLLLLQSDDVTAPDRVLGRVGAHVAGCATCGELVRKLRRLNDAVRSLPNPSDMDAARLRFEYRHAASLGRGPRKSHARRWAVAALLLLGVGGGVAAYLHHETETRAVASSEAIDRAVNFNLTLSRSESIDERQKLFAERISSLASDTGRFVDDTREFADNLIRSAKFLTEHHDPLAQADHFTDVADLIVTRMDTTARRNPKALARLGQDYFNVMNQGVHTNLDLAASNTISTAEYRQRLDKIIRHNEQLQAKLQATLRNNPDQAQVHKQLDQLERRLHKLKQKAAAAAQPGAVVPKPNPVR